MNSPAPQTVADFQQMVSDFMHQRGWQNKSVILQTMMMSEEMGEVCKAVRNLADKGDSPELKHELALELADVFNYCCWLATCHGIDLAAAVREKMAINAKRTWA